jgi:hypothetical protein
MLKISVGTVSGRHQLPVQEYVINEEIEDVTDVDSIQKKVNKYFEENIANVDDKVELILYVTGLTLVVLAIVNACKKYGCDLVCMHYDRENDCYIGQKILI